MDTLEFRKKLKLAQDLMSQEMFLEALNILKELKAIEKNKDFDYNLTHKLYQLLSNSQSLYNQQVILKIVNKIIGSQKSITFKELREILQKITNLNIDMSVLRKEIELLILRNMLNCKIENDQLIF
ncbi:MAG: hypothetical protein ACFFDN_39715 [Candidatus Hodarchaeota archaeon]